MVTLSDILGMRTNGYSLGEGSVEKDIRANPDRSFQEMAIPDKAHGS
jgi:hypothetical protein